MTARFIPRNQYYSPLRFITPLLPTTWYKQILHPSFWNVPPVENVVNHKEQYECLPNDVGAAAALLLLLKEIWSTSPMPRRHYTNPMTQTMVLISVIIIPIIESNLPAIHTEKNNNSVFSTQDTKYQIYNERPYSMFDLTLLGLTL